MCLPYAGGSAIGYRAWGSALPALDVCAFELPGRGVRFKERPAHDARTLVAEIADAVLPLTPVAVFGHSMGGMLGIELARALGEGVTHVFVSAAPAPRSAREHHWSTLSDADLLAQLRSWGGTPEEALANDELMELILPVLRADLSLFDHHSISPEPRLACPITAFAGTRDRDVPIADVCALRAYTTGPFELVTVEGGHFFIHDPLGRSVVLRRLLGALA